MKIHKDSLRAAEQFLRNREWLIHSTTNIKDALQYVLTNKPSFVMICMDHPVKKMRSLPKLLVQALPVCVIAYTEASNAQAFRLLMDSGCEYKINPPVTGPAIERTVNKFIRDQQNIMMKAQNDEIRAREETERSGGVAGDVESKKRRMQTDAGGNIVISGNKDDSRINNSVMDEELTQAQKMLMDMSLTETDEDSDSLDASFLNGNNQGGQVSGGSPQDSGGMWMPMSQTKKKKNSGNSSDVSDDDENNFEPGSLGKKSNLAYMPTHEKAAEAEEGNWVPNEVDKLNPNFEQGKIGEDIAGEFEPSTLGKSMRGLNSGSTQSSDNFEPGSLNEDQQNEDPNDLSNFLKKLTPKKKNGSTENGQDVDSEGQGSYLADIKKKIAEAPDLLNRKNEFSKNDSIIAKGTQKALDESTNVQDGLVHEKLSENGNIACIVVDSPRFSGYLVAALGKNRKIDQSFINLIKMRLFKFLIENGELINEDEDAMNIKIQQVEFEDWAVEYAEFLRKSVHNGDEVAMAFFPFSQAKTVLGESADVEMGSVKIGELQPDTPVEFNLYIYLPGNKKYVLYTPKGGKFYSNQKDRLAKMGVTEMHMKKEEAQDLSKYRAQNYLNSKINDYEANKKNKKKAS